MLEAKPSRTDRQESNTKLEDKVSRTDRQESNVVRRHQHRSRSAKFAKALPSASSEEASDIPSGQAAEPWWLRYVPASIMVSTLVLHFQWKRFRKEETKD